MPSSFNFSIILPAAFLHSSSAGSGVPSGSPADPFSPFFLPEARVLFLAEWIYYQDETILSSTFFGVNMFGKMIHILIFVSSEDRISQDFLTLFPVDIARG